jgi:NAD(P)-dependent dehydrogenase (short-subunit alcohol dehydrogenase family)
MHSMKRQTVRLENKIAVITGGCSGIGLATVELFVAEGAQVVVGDVQDDKGAALQARFPSQVHFKHCDVAQESDIRVLMDFANATVGGLDILFNNAGAGGSRARIDEIDGDAWDATHALLLRSVALGIRYAAPFMKQRGGGSIVNTASIAAITSGAAPVAYSAAKAGVLHLTKVAASQLACFNIRVNAICPGFVFTNIFGDSMSKTVGVTPEAVKAALLQVAPTLQPIAKVGMPEDIANACLFFASSDSAFVTGAHLVVDGGSTVGPRSSWDPATPTLANTLLQKIGEAKS